MKKACVLSKSNLMMENKMVPTPPPKKTGQVEERYKNVFGLWPTVVAHLRENTIPCPLQFLTRKKIICFRERVLLVLQLSAAPRALGAPTDFVQIVGGRGLKKGFWPKPPPPPPNGMRTTRIGSILNLWPPSLCLKFTSWRLKLRPLTPVGVRF